MLKIEIKLLLFFFKYYGLVGNVTVLKDPYLKIKMCTHHKRGILQAIYMILFFCLSYFDHALPFLRRQIFLKGG